MTPQVSQIRGVRFLGHDTPLDLAIRGGRIASITRAGSTSALPGGVDAAGRYLTSGLWDEHVHFGQWAEHSTRLDLGAAHSAADALAILGAALTPRERTSAGELGVRSSTALPELVAVRARGGSWPDRLTRTSLDAVTGPRPVVVIGMDLHSVWLNSAALTSRGLPIAGDGHLVEDACFALLRELDQRPADALDTLVTQAAAAAAARGVVGIVDFEMRWCIDDWIRREARGFSLLRVEASIYPYELERAISAGYRSGDVLGESGRLRVGPVKIITDGSLGTGTAWCCAPYTSGGHGRSLVQADELLRIMRRATTTGFGLAIHAIGDRAAAQVLDGFAALGSGGRIEHAQLLRAEDIERFKELGVEASVQPTHLVDDQSLVEREWPGLANRAFPLASLHAAGAHLCFGSDAPVAPLDPWIAIQSAVTRAASGADPWTPAERLPVAIALASSMRGRLRPETGDVADLMLLDDDPLQLPPERLSSVQPAATLVNGSFTHRASALA